MSSPLSNNNAPSTNIDGRATPQSKDAAKGR
jgi:hypothetical protein